MALDNLNNIQGNVEGETLKLYNMTLTLGGLAGLCNNIDKAICTLDIEGCLFEDNFTKKSSLTALTMVLKTNPHIKILRFINNDYKEMDGFIRFLGMNYNNNTLESMTFCVDTFTEEEKNNLIKKAQEIINEPKVLVFLQIYSPNKEIDFEYSKEELEEKSEEEQSVQGPPPFDQNKFNDKIKQLKINIISSKLSLENPKQHATIVGLITPFISDELNSITEVLEFAKCIGIGSKNNPGMDGDLLKLRKRKRLGLLFYKFRETDDSQVIAEHCITKALGFCDTNRATEDEKQAFSDFLKIKIARKKKSEVRQDALKHLDGLGLR